MNPALFQNWPNRFRALSVRRQRALLGAGTALVVTVVFALGVFAGHHTAEVRGARANTLQLSQHNDELQDQLAILQRDKQVSQVADRVLQRNLTERDEEIRSLRADQAFYSKLVGADALPGGLAVHGVAVTPIPRTHAWNFSVTLTHSAEGAQEIQGKLTIAVEGVRADKLTQLDWSQLGAPASTNGLPFDFKYFQQVQGTLMLPDGFTPNRILVTLDPQSGATVTRTLAWSEAVQGAAGGAPAGP